MRYYTKDWYELMQNLHYVSGMTVIPDKEYTDTEIQAFYDADLAEEIEHDRELYHTPPMQINLEHLLEPDVFSPDMFLFEDEATGKLYYPETVEEAGIVLEKKKSDDEDRFAMRPPFNPAETIQCFEECYRGLLKYGMNGYPEWIRPFIDPRLSALGRMTEGAYHRLKKLEDENQAAFDEINRQAEEVLMQQDIPEDIRSRFCFHDANVLALKRSGKDVYLYLRKDGGWMEPMTPYIKVVLKNVSFIDREKGMVLRKRKNEDGEYTSNYTYLYDELYRTKTGYEVHMLLWSFRHLRYLTIGCEDIEFEDNIETVF